MLSCNTSSVGGIPDLFRSCKQGPTRLKKIGQYLYHYDCQIGTGTYSQVYEGISIQTNKPVAIKVVDLQMIKQKNLASLLFQETQLLSELSHPNVITCHSLLKSENRCYIVMQLCRKDNLEALVERSKNRRLPNSQIERIIYDIFEGLQYLSRKAIIHRDLKTANILFSSQTGKAKIADFGFATRSLNEFKDNVFVGTPLYMSPEAIIQQKYGPKTDIWSFGVIVHELVLGYAPLSHCKNQDELLSTIVKHVSVTDKGLNQSLVQLIEGCLQPNVHYRWSIDKLAKSAYIQHLRKKYYIQANIFQPIKVPKKQQTNTANTSKYSTSMQTKIHHYLNNFSKEDQPSFSSKDISTKYHQTINSQKQISSSPIKQQLRNQPISSTIAVTGINTGIKSGAHQIKTYSSLNSHGYLNGTGIQKKINLQHAQSMGLAHDHCRIKIQHETSLANGLKCHTEISSVKSRENLQLERQSMGAYQSIKLTSKLRNPTHNHSKTDNQASNLSIQPTTRIGRQISIDDQSSKKISKLTLKSIESGNSQLTFTMNMNMNMSIKKDQFSHVRSQPQENLQLMERKSQLPIMSDYFAQCSASFSLFRNKKLTYKQAVCFVHYCRLLHKILQFPRYFNSYLKRWLIFLVKDLKDNGQVNSLKQAHLHSLKTVLQGYHNQYLSQHKPTTPDPKQFMPQTKSVIKILKSLSQIDEQNHEKGMEKDLLNYLLKDTKIVQQCLVTHEIGIEEYVRSSQCQLRERDRDRDKKGDGSQGGDGKVWKNQGK